MPRYLRAAGAGLVAVVAATGCSASFEQPAATRVAETSPAPTPLLVPNASAASTTVTTGTVPAPVSSVVMVPAPPIPADLPLVRPTVAEEPDAGDRHEHDSPQTDGDVATAWTVTIFTGRFDDTAGAVTEALAALATPAIVEATVSSIPAPDPALLEVRWPIVTDVTDVGGGWWHVTYVLKRLVAGQVGPTTSPPASVVVHVAGGVVDDWEPVAR